MPVKNTRTPTNNSFLGEITGLTEKEKKVIADAGLGDGASKLTYDDGFILLDKSGKVIEGQDNPVTFDESFTIADNVVKVNTDDVSMVDIAVNVSGSGTTLTSLKIGNTLYTIPYSDYVTINTAQTISGDKTFTGLVKTNEIDNTNGNALVRYKSTEAVNVYGGANYNCLLMGKGDRPYYSKDGSDFTGEALLLAKDIESLIRYRSDPVDVLVGNSNYKLFLTGAAVRPRYIPYVGNASDLALMSDVESVLPDNPTDDGSYVLGNTVASGSATKEWNSTEDVDFVSLPAVDTSTDGAYVLKATVASGAVTYSWVKE